MPSEEMVAAVQEASVRLDHYVETGDEEDAWRLYWFFDEVAGHPFGDNGRGYQSYPPELERLMCAAVEAFGVDLDEIERQARLKHFGWVWLKHPFSDARYVLERIASRDDSPRFKLLNDGDWAEAFGCAGDSGQYLGVDISAVPGSDVPTDPFRLNDVAELLAADEGENDGPEWLAAGRLYDGRWFFVAAGCDYTGWD